MDMRIPSNRSFNSDFARLPEEVTRENRKRRREQLDNSRNEQSANRLMSEIKDDLRAYDLSNSAGAPRNSSAFQQPVAPDQSSLPVEASQTGSADPLAAQRALNEIGSLTRPGFNGEGMVQ